MNDFKYVTRKILDSVGISILSSLSLFHASPHHCSPLDVQKLCLQLAYTIFKAHIPLCFCTK